MCLHQAEWVGQHLGPALESAGLSHIKLMVLDDNRIFLPKWVDEVSHKDSLTLPFSKTFDSTELLHCKLLLPI